MSETRKRWQDWVTVVLGVAVFVAPFVTQTTSVAGAWSAYLGGALLLIAGVWSLASPDARWVEWVQAIVGVVLFITPWALGFADSGGLAWTAWIGGVLAVALSGSVLLSERDTPVMASQG